MSMCGSGGIAALLLALALDEVDWSASRPVHFTPGKEILVSAG
jgi:hypothetical protein